jgi:hypothetical protein
MVQYADLWGRVKWWEKKPEREEEEKEEASGRKGGRWLKIAPWRHRSWCQARRQWSGANIVGAMLGGNNISTMGVAMSLPRLRRRLRQPRTLAPKVLAPRCVISSPITMAPSWGSRFWKHTSSGIFVKIFQKGPKNKKFVSAHSTVDLPHN